MNQPQSQSRSLTQAQRRRQIQVELTLNPTREKISYDHDLDRLTITRTEDVQPHIDAVKEDRNDMRNGFSKSGNWRKIGSIPMSIVAKWYGEGFNCLDPNNAKEVRRRLNDMSKFRGVDKPV